MTSTKTNEPPLLAYRGVANQWEADEGGHLNVRFHVERSITGLAVLGARMAMPRAFKHGATATLLPQDMHIQFLKEARPGAQLSMQAGVLELGESDGRFIFDMGHGDGAPAAAFTLKAAHVEPRSLKAFAWSARSRAAVKSLMCAAPAHSLPRSIDTNVVREEPSLARADALGAIEAGLSVIQANECDVFGRMRPEMVFGRASDAAGRVFGPMRRAVGDVLGQTLAGAVTEARLVFRRWPECGDLVAVRSGIMSVKGKIARVAHWLLDPLSGQCWANIEAIALAFDVETRKAAELEGVLHGALQEKTRELLVPGMGL